MKRKHSFDILFVLALFCVFAITILLTLSIGADIYRSISGRTNVIYEDRTPIGYIDGKLKNSDKTGSISLGKFGGVDTILIKNIYYETEYTTFLYYYDGYLREVILRDTEDFEPDLGFEVISAGDLSFDYVAGSGDKLIYITCTSNSGSVSELYYNLKSTEGTLNE